jgi:23S rRNA (guanosine2251-2'-O)-methyltransferase
MRTFNTVLYRVLSPQNVGMIIRSHVAFGGKYLIFAGYDEPWAFKPGTQGFSRKLESKCNILHFLEFEDLLAWSRNKYFKNIAIEISKSGKPVVEFRYPDHCNFIVGNEGAGIPDEVLRQCDEIIYIPQFGEVECLNVAVSASIVLFDFTRNNINAKEIRKNKFNPG